MKYIKKLVVWTVQAGVSYWQFQVLYHFLQAEKSKKFWSGLLELGLIYLAPSISMLILLLILGGKNDADTAQSARFTTLAFPIVATVLSIIAIIRDTGRFFYFLLFLLLMALVFLIAGVAIALLIALPFAKKFYTSGGAPGKADDFTREPQQVEPVSFTPSVRYTIYLRDNMFDKGTVIGWVDSSGTVMKADSVFGGGDPIGTVKENGEIYRGTGAFRDFAGKIRNDGYVENSSSNYIGLVKPNGDVYRLTGGIFGQIPETNSIGSVEPPYNGAGAALLLLF